MALKGDMRSSSLAYSLLYALSLLHGEKMVVNIGSCVSTRRYEGLAEILPSSKALPYSRTCDSVYCVLSLLCYQPIIDVANKVMDKYNHTCIGLESSRKPCGIVCEYRLHLPSLGPCHAGPLNLCMMVHSCPNHTKLSVRFSTMKLLGIVLRNRCWPTTFHTITDGGADG